MKGYLIFALLLIIFVNPVSAISISPGVIDLGQVEPGVYERTITISSAESATITMSITPRSKYLERYVRFSPGVFSIHPGESKGVMITLDLRNHELDNGAHSLFIMPSLSGHGSGSGINVVGIGVAELRFSIPGDVNKKLELEEFTIEKNEFILKLKNTGDKRVSAFPVIEVWKIKNFLTWEYYELVAKLKGTTQFLIEKGDSVTASIESGLGDGKYRLIAYAEYDDKLTNKIEKNITTGTIETKSINTTKNTTKKRKEEKPVGGYVNVGDEKVEGINILSLSAYPVLLGDSLPIELMIENNAKDAINYSVFIHILDGDKELLVINRSGVLNAFEIKKINASWLADKPGDYSVKAEIVYDKDGTRKRMEKTIRTRVMAAGITGMVTSSSVKLIIIIILVLLILIYKWGGKRKFRYSFR